MFFKLHFGFTFLMKGVLEVNKIFKIRKNKDLEKIILPRIKQTLNKKPRKRLSVGLGWSTKISIVFVCLFFFLSALLRNSFLC